MANTPKQTPLTVETFEKLIMPVLDRKFESINSQFATVNKQFDGVNKEIKSLKDEVKSVRNNQTKVMHTVNELKEIVIETNKRVKYLPTTEEYLASQDKLMKELQKSREATEFTGQHYTDTNDRIDRIDKHIGFNSLLN